MCGEELPVLGSAARAEPSSSSSSSGSAPASAAQGRTMLIPALLRPLRRKEADGTVPSSTQAGPTVPGRA